MQRRKAQSTLRLLQTPLPSALPPPLPQLHSDICSRKKKLEGEVATEGESIGEVKGSIFPQMSAYLGQLQAPPREFQSREPEALKSCFSGCALQYRGDHCLPLLLPLSHLCGPPVSVLVKGPEPSLRGSRRHIPGRKGTRSHHLAVGRRV